MAVSAPSAPAIIRTDGPSNPPTRLAAQLMGFTELERLKLGRGLSVGAALAARPARVALLVPPLEGADWQAMFESALATLCGLWGGEGNLVLPWGPDAEKDSTLWDILYCFDPDIVALYTPTLSELALIDQPRYDRSVAEIRQSVAAAEGLDENAREQFLAHELSRPVLPFEPGDAFEVLRTRLCVLDAIDPIGWYALDGESDLAYPFTDVKALGVPDAPVQDPVCGLSMTARLLLTARLGRLPPRLRRWLVDRERVETFRVDEWSKWLTQLSDRRRAAGMADPWANTRRGLASYQMFQPDRKVTLVVGTQPIDFALFYAVSRLAPPAFWMPTDGLPRRQLADYNQSTLMDAAFLAQRSGGREILVTTASDPDRRDTVAGQIKDALLSDSLSGRAVDPHEVLPRSPNRLFELDSEGQPGELVLDEEGASQPLPTPIPRDALKAEPFALRWMTDVRIQRWAPIASAALAKQLITAPRSSVRVADAGVSFLSPVHTNFGGGTVKGLTPTPTVHRLSLFEQISSVCEHDGWTAKASDKGVYAEQSAVLFGGLQELRSALMDPATRAVLETFRGEKAGRRFRDRTYLRLEELPDPNASALAQRLERRGVLLRGLALKCVRCRQGDFYPLGALSESFRCSRCGLDQRHGAEHWLGAAEPQWHFGLAEVVFQFLEHDGDVPVHAAGLLMEDAVLPASVAFEIELYDQAGEKSEHDLLISLGSHLLIGEATSTDRLGSSRSAERKRLRRLTQVADLLGARTVVLASAAPAFAQRTREDANNLLVAPWRRVRLIEGLQRGSP